VQKRVLVTGGDGFLGSHLCERLPNDDPKPRCPDISLARKVLKWSPEIERREGLARTIPYFDELLRKA